MVKDGVRGHRAGILCVFCVEVKKSTAAAAAEKESARLVSLGCKRCWMLTIAVYYNSRVQID